MQIDKRKPLGIAIFAILAPSVIVVVTLLRNVITFTVKYFYAENKYTNVSFLVFVATQFVDNIVKDGRY